MTRWIARIAWVLPLFFFALTVHQAWVAYNLYVTLTQGQPETAQVLEVHQENRVDVTYDYVHLRVELADGRVIDQPKMSVPHSLIQLMEGKKTVPVRVRPASSQEIVVVQIGSTQWRIAAMNAAMAFVAGLVFGIGVFYWNRYLEREGDPATRGLATADSDHPARQINRA